MTRVGLVAMTLAFASALSLSPLSGIGAQRVLAGSGIGTVAGWGADNLNQRAIPPNLSDVTAISAGANHVLARLSDGTVIAWGDNRYGQAHVPRGLDTAMAISAGANHSLALESNGTIDAWGDDTFGQTEIPDGLWECLIPARIESRK